MRASYVAQNNRWIKSSHKWKTEGASRGFPVWINWEVHNGMLQGRPVFDRPYGQNPGNIIATLKECFEEIGIPYQDGFEFEMLRGRFTEDTVVR